jgi:dihydroxyacetone kinase-like protein
MGALRTVMEEVLLVDVTTVANWITRASSDFEDNKDHLTHLDAAIGDADHGINLVRGFTAAVAAVAEKQPPTPGELLTLVGNTLISKVGGASGPLYGTAFRRAGKALGTEADVAPEALGAALQAGLEGVQGLGAAAEGDKTMVDALAPAVRAYQHALATGASIADAAQAAAAAAEKGAEATIPLQALKGRASYLGARSVGHQDPGATSTALLLAALAAALGGPGS